MIPVIRENGRVESITTTAFDITERIEQAQELLAAKASAESANLSKTTFLANMSHEIRTPMTAVLGFAELLKEPHLPEDQRDDAISRIQRSGQTLLKLIDDILDISKVESGKFSTEKLRFSPREVVAEVTALLRLQAEQKGLALQANIDSSVPPIAFSDPTIVRQILTNLIGNGIKFTCKGLVHVHVSAEKDHSSDKQFLIFDVFDTGIGIAQSDQAKLYQPFVQADESINRQFGGTGLGLILSKRLAQQLGGDLLLVKSTQQAGSQFQARLEAGPFEGARVAEIEARDHSKLAAHFKPPSARASAVS